ncbi:MAG: hypothetical protein AB7T63_16810 [Planctomycetota bacterium]
MTSDAPEGQGASCPIGNLTTKGRRVRLFGGVGALVGLSIVLAVGPTGWPLWTYLAAAGALAGVVALNGLQSGSGT